MNPKLIGGVLGLLVLGLVGYFAFANIVNKSPKTSSGAFEINYDFGDAPDGKEGQFPSLLASNGARVKKTDQVWLGQVVTTENDSKQVDKDEADDGVKLNATSCSQSTAYFFVQVKDPGKASGNAYLNLYADWNKDGRWSGSDECASEWAVANFTIDLTKQIDQIAVYQIQFTAGKNVDEIWYRGAVTQDAQMNEAATGEFGRGEVEDWRPSETQKEYWLYCDPYPLVLNHGDEKTVAIKAAPFSQKIKSVALSTLVAPDNDIRKISQNGNSFVYKSKKVDGPKRDEPDAISYSAEFADGEKWWDWCPVTVHHDEPPTTIKPPGLPIPSKAPNIETKSGGSTKTEPPQSQPENHPTQEAPGVVTY
ncbi:hypothetical protein HYZ70_01790 [Candidatus Curtissbacteria bacterium]|nr:hypothetical protein [Candidatus Curtissbacteria bacterium]